MKKFTKALAISLMLILCVSVFAACTPKTADAIRERYEEEGYTVIKIEAKDFAQYGIDTEGAEVEWAIVAMKGLLSGEVVTAVCFKDTADAKKMEDDYNSLSDSEKADQYFLRSGAVVVMAGSEEALKIAK